MNLPWICKHWFYLSACYLAPDKWLLSFFSACFYHDHWFSSAFFLSSYPLVVLHWVVCWIGIRAVWDRPFLAVLQALVLAFRLLLPFRLLLIAGLSLGFSLESDVDYEFIFVEFML